MIEQFFSICSSEPTSEPRDSPRLVFNLGNFRAPPIFSEAESTFANNCIQNIANMDVWPKGDDELFLNLVRK